MCRWGQGTCPGSSGGSLAFALSLQCPGDPELVPTATTGVPGLGFSTRRRAGSRTPSVRGDRTGTQPRPSSNVSSSPECPDPSHGPAAASRTLPISASPWWAQQVAGTPGLCRGRRGHSPQGTQRCSCRKWRPVLALLASAPPRPRQGPAGWAQATGQRYPCHAGPCRPPQAPGAAYLVHGTQAGGAARWAGQRARAQPGDLPGTECGLESAALDGGCWGEPQLWQERRGAERWAGPERGRGQSSPQPGRGTGLLGMVALACHPVLQAGVRHCPSSRLTAETGPRESAAGPALPGGSVHPRPPGPAVPQAGTQKRSLLRGTSCRLGHALRPGQ